MDTIYSNSTANGEFAETAESIQVESDNEISSPLLIEIEDLNPPSFPQQPLSPSLSDSLYILPIIPSPAPSSIPSVHKRKRIRTSGASEVADALSTLTQTVRDLDKKKEDINNTVTNAQQAIVLLQEEYKDILSDEEMAYAYMIFECDIKAKNFLIMSAGGGRDIWLRFGINNQRRSMTDYN